MKNILAGLALTSVLFISFTIAPAAEARGRTGSIRVGGHTSHGKGSHYIAGHVRSGAATHPRSHR